MNQNESMIVFIQWSEFVEWLFTTTDKFPKKARFSFSQRIEGLALDVVEDLVEARYTKNRGPILKRANLRLEKLRILLRLSHKLQYLSHASYEFATRGVNETGKLLGGWMKSNE